MNSTELENINSLFGTTEGKTMEDYFTEVNNLMGIDIDTLKSEFKKFYSDITDWSF